MKNVLLIQPLPSLIYKNNTELYSEFDSFGLAIIATFLEKNNFNITNILYLSSEKELEKELVNIDIIIIGDFRYYSYFCNPYFLIQQCLVSLEKFNFSGKVIIGGRHSDFFSETIKGNQNRLKIYIASSVESIGKSLGLKSSDFLILGKNTLPCPYPINLKFLNNDKLTGSISRPNRLNIAQIIIDSGCKFNCSFCEKARSDIQSFPIRYLLKLLEDYATIGKNYLIFWDEVFGKSKNTDSILNLLKELNLSFTCNTRLDSLNIEFITKLAIGNCKSILIGLEVGGNENDAQNYLKIDYRKKKYLEKLESIISLLNEFNIDLIGSLIIGLPNDTEEIISNRILHYSNLGLKKIYIRPLVVFPGSAIYLESIAKNIIKPYEEWNNTELQTYPLGYPTICRNLNREDLSQWIKN